MYQRKTCVVLTILIRSFSGDYLVYVVVLVFESISNQKVSKQQTCVFFICQSFIHQSEGELNP
jgi:hypothetical protein